MLFLSSLSGARTGNKFWLAVLLSTASLTAVVNSSLAQTANPESVAATTRAPDDPDREVIVITGSRGTVEALSPAKASLDAFEPQTIISRTFIEDSVADTADYTNVIMFAPSVSGVSSNGPGLSEKKFVLRGFQNGEYNITFDGIPFGDTNDPTHHSTAYFPASTIGAVEVDRGPGFAGDLGQQNFGGSVKLLSRSLSDDPYLQQKFTIGSWNTFNLVTTLQSGADNPLIKETRITLNFQELMSDGYLTNAGVRAFNQFFKLQSSLGSDITLTVLANHNGGHVFQADNAGATLAQIAKYGKNFALTKDPSLPSYYLYNTVTKDTDMEYIRLNASLERGFSAENTSYTYAYTNNTISATDTTQSLADMLSGKYPGQGTKAAATGNKDIAGYDKLNSYRVLGNISRLNYDFSFGQARAGIWYEYAATDRHRFDLDRTLGVPNPIEKAPAFGPTPPADLQFLENSNWTQVQPFFDLELRPLPGLTVTPGIKYVDFTRNIDSPIESKTRLVDRHQTASFSKTLAFASANYKILDNWSAYANYGEGFLIPPLKVFYFPNASAHPGLKPQQSTNYQLGTVFKTNNLTLDGDIYYIDFTDKFGTVGPSSDAYYVNLPGRVNYKGVEVEATYALDDGIALFVDGSITSAKEGIGTQLKGAPQWTAGAGAIYKQNQITASLLTKVVGPQWAQSGQPTYYRIAPYETTNLIVGYEFGRFKIEGGIYNLFNDQSLTDVTINDGPTPNPLNSHDQYFYQPERSFQITLRATL